MCYFAYVQILRELVEMGFVCAESKEFVGGLF
jgi:hypothetical protein